MTGQGKQSMEQTGQGNIRTLHRHARDGAPTGQDSQDTGRTGHVQDTVKTGQGHGTDRAQIE